MTFNIIGMPMALGTFFSYIMAVKYRLTFSNILSIFYSMARDIHLELFHDISCNNCSTILVYSLWLSDSTRRHTFGLALDRVMTPSHHLNPYGLIISGDLFMMTSSNGNIFRVTGHLCGEFTGHRWIPRTNASDAELSCFLWSAPE